MSDVIVFPKSYKSSAELKTGDWRTLRPEFTAKISACQNECPIHNQIPGWFQLAGDGKLKEAWRKLIETNPFPSVLGRVCPKPCEKKCLRKDFDDPLAINSFEKFLGDLALRNNWQPRVSLISHKAKKIAIVGAGPAGLACAYQLRLMGHYVNIFEAESVMGGMLYLGIPEYRLPKKILTTEIKGNILSLGGIYVNLKWEINRSRWFDLVENFDAVLVACGRRKNKILELENVDRTTLVYSGLDFLKQVNLGKASVGNGVVVIGGGNTAVDSARCAKKLGAEHVTIVYRRNKEDMPAYKEEIDAAEKEGIHIIPRYVLISVDWPYPVAPLTKDGLYCDKEIGLQLKCAITDIIDSKVVIRPNYPNLGMCASDLIMAIGEEADISFVDPIKGHEKVFTAGDAFNEDNGGTVASAIGSGNKAAQEIDFYLKNGKRRESVANNQRVVRFQEINLNYFSHCRSILKAMCSVNSEVLEKAIKEESARCLSCGLCDSCGNCWLYCPDLAVSGESGKYEFNYDYCKGCGICANECPRRVIDMALEVK